MDKTKLTSIRIEAKSYERIERFATDMRFYKKSEVINNILTAVFENFTDQQIRDMISRYLWWKNKVETKFEVTKELKPLKRG